MRLRLWQAIDFWGRMAVLVAAFCQFFVVSMTDFDFEVFWYYSMENQAQIAEIVANPELDYDQRTERLNSIWSSQRTRDGYSDFHNGLRSAASWAFLSLFAAGSLAILIGRRMEFHQNNREQELAKR